jgi:hypothetical protein
MKEFIAILKNELVKTIRKPRSFIGFGGSFYSYRSFL